MKNLKNKITEKIILEYYNTYNRVIEDGICKNLKIEIIEPISDDFEAEYWMKTANEMEIELIKPLKLKATMIWEGEPFEEIVEKYGAIFMIGYTTKSGYYSRKKVDVDFEYRPKYKYETFKITQEQAAQLVNFINYDAKENTFDPFWHENEAKRKNASALVWLSKKITDSRWG